MLLRYALLGYATLFILSADGQNANSLQDFGRKVSGVGPNNETSATGARNDSEMTEKEKQDYVKELENEIATVIADNIQIAIATIAEKGDIFTDNETKEFFETVAGHVLTLIEDRINILRELVQDQDLVARGIAEDIARKITKDVKTQTMTDLPNDVKENVITGGVIGIPKEMELFIKQILISPA